MVRRIMILAAVMLIVGGYLLLARTADTGTAIPARFTPIAHAQDQTGTTAAKRNLSKCIITLAYVEFVVDGKYHTPRVTITDQGRRLKKNIDYKLEFRGGRDAGKSTVTVTGIGVYAGKVTRTYKGISAETKTSTTKTSAVRKTTTKKTTVKTTVKTSVKTTVKTTGTAAAATTKRTTAAVKTTTKKKTTEGTKPTTRKKTAAATKTKAAAKSKQRIRSISSHTFSEGGAKISAGAKASSGLKLRYRSSNPRVATVDAKGIIRAKRAGTAKITITQNGSGRYKPASRKVKVVVPSFRSRETALKPWRHVLIDTFFYINGRKYSRGNPGKYWKNSHGKWSGKTGKKGDTQSCVTLSTVSLKRAGLIPANSGCIWLSSNHGTKPNKTVRKLRKSSKTLSVSYPHKSLKYLARNDMIRYGDILCRSGHTFIYMGKDSGGHPLIYECGTRRDIGGGTCVIWGHHSGGHADKLTGKINKQIKRSDEAGEKWKKGKLSDSAFRGHRASGKNLNKPVHIVCSIRTFKVRTCCTNGTITPGNIYMAGESATVKFHGEPGTSLEYVKVDGKRINIKSKYTFRNICADHTVKVQYKL